MEQILPLLAAAGVFAPMALGAIGSIIGCAIAGSAACGAMLDTDEGHGKFIGASAMPSSQTIYGIVTMFILKGGLDAAVAAGTNLANLQAAYFAIGLLAGVANMLSAIYQGKCCAAAIFASKKKPEVFGKSIAPAGMVEGFAVFVFVMVLIVKSIAG